MRLSFALLVSSLASVALGTSVEYATQTFFIPMPEDMVMTNTFKKINSAASGLVNTMISLTISIDNTVVIYDHWEDGYEPTSSKTQASTQIWGDGDASNGCAPLPGVSCTDANDKLKAGTAIILEDRMVVPRSTSKIHYDGGDRILATKPVAITRGSFPDIPGSLMAGAVEVLDTFGWGLEFEAPVGTNSDITTNAFQYVAFYIQAKDDGTEVRLNGGSSFNLNRGKSQVILNVLQGWKITTNKPVQVTLITGDPGSTYELRWYALLPTKDWSNSYVSPVGDSVGQSRLVIYNPGSSSLSVTYETLSYRKSVSVSAGKSFLTDVIPTGSGCFVDASQNFIVLSLTDTVGTGQIYDWGFPVMPRSKLTPQVLVGLGFGCTNNDCKGGTERSVVWISPVADADVMIDFNNDGVVDKTFSANRLTSNIITDTYSRDQDMSGAIIFATAKGTGATGPAVDIASAWGQNPAFSGNNDNEALDLGTVILPYDPIRVTEHCTVVVDSNGDGKVSSGDTVEITMKVMNMGQVDLPRGYFAVSKPNMSQMKYVPGSTKCTNQDTGTVYDISDNGSLPTLTSQATIQRRGGTHDFSFRAKIDAGAQLPEGYCEVLNFIQGELTTGLETPPSMAPTSAQTGAPMSPTKVQTSLLDGCPAATPRKILVIEPPGSSTSVTGVNTLSVTDAPTATPTTLSPTWSPRQTSSPTAARKIVRISARVPRGPPPPPPPTKPPTIPGEPCGCGDKTDSFDGTGFVTGGGWVILGPTAVWSGQTIGSDPKDRRANFGFNAKFKGTTPGGSTNFVFEGGANFHFHSTTGGSSYDFLEVPDAIRARWKGTGTLATGTSPKQSDFKSGYSFLVAVQDFGEPGAEDTWRIRIWETSNPSNVIFDTNPEATTSDSSSDRFKGTTLGQDGPNGGGNIQLHRKGQTPPLQLAPGQKCHCKETPKEGDGNGFVTGGGWVYINYAEWKDDNGVVRTVPPNTKANFGFNAKFQGGTPRGSTNFVVSGIDFHFHSATGNTPLDFLEVPSETEALWRGTGSVATGANPKNKDFKDGYSFVVAVQDMGEPGAFDTWRIRIWKTATGAVVFDTNPEEALTGPYRFEGTQLGEESATSNGGGNVQIHWK